MAKVPVLPATSLGAVVLGLSVLAAPSWAADPPIRLKAATFDPTLGEPALAARLRHRALAAHERGTYIVQFVGPIEDAWKAAVAAAGGELLDYVPEYAFKVRMRPAQALAVRRLPSVRWVGLFHPAYKLSPRLARAGERPYVLRLEPGSNGASTEAAIRALGVRGLKRDGQTLVVVAAAEQLEAMAAVDDVAWIENFMPRVKHNDKGGGVILGAATANASGYDGSTQTIAVADTGIGGGTPATAHAHVPASRIAAISDWPGMDFCFESMVVSDGSRDVDSGHGTHTSLSAVGDGGASGLGKGTAPAARLFFQSVENYVVPSLLCQLIHGLSNGYYLTGIPLDIRPLFQQAYTAGARVHSDSWGSPAAGDYTDDSANADEFVWSHRDMTITFSAGNEGVDSDANGGVDGDSMGSPATAKNVISVGASENDRASDYPCDAARYPTCAAQGGQNGIFTWSAFGFAGEPLSSDPSAGNAEQMAAFSSRGPTDDGRIKPDVVAPGSWVLSGFSDLYQFPYDASPNPQNGFYQLLGWGNPLNDKLKYFGGTSMSAPLVAGGAAVVRDYYQKLHGHAASAALVKATLVNSAQDLLDEDNDGVNNNALAIPNFYEGWGRVDLAAATDGSRQFVEQATGLSTGAMASYAFDVAAGTPLKVTLVWSDYPGNGAATKDLVNNLDLEVSGPGGAFFRGNVFGGGWSVPGGLLDNTNNVENVYVQTPAAGVWTVTVRGFNVPQGPQPFALVVAGQLDTPPPVTHVLTVTPPSNGTVTSGDGFITCGSGGSACSHAYDEGSVVILSTTANPGFVRTGWTGDCAGSGATCTLTMNQAHVASATFAPNIVGQPVIWTLAVGASISGNSLTKTAATGWGNSGAISSQLIPGDGFLQVTGTANSAYRMIGLSNGNSSNHYNDIDFALCLCASELRVYEAGVLRGTFGAFATGNLLRVAVAGTTVTYSKNGVVFYTSAATPTHPLLVDAALHLTGATLNNAVIGGAGPPPPLPVVWISPVGLTVSGNSLTKTAATGWGNSGAVSSQQITGDGYVEVTGTANSSYRMFGLSNGSSSNHYNDIDYAICECASQIRVYEGGVLRGTFGNFATGNLLRVAVVGSTVTYSLNGVVFYTSSVAPTRPLLVDAALHGLGATINNAVISMTP